MWRTTVRLAILALATMLTGGCVDHDPDESVQLSDKQKIALIDSMRPKGSYEQARERLNRTVARMAERITAAIPGQTWRFDDDPYGREVKRSGLSCDNGLEGDVAGRPLSDTILFGATFTAEQWPRVTEIVRQEAAEYGIDDQSSLFNDPSKRDYLVQGNGYEFNVGRPRSPH